jgi:hypothetical protein
MEKQTLSAEECREHAKACRELAGKESNLSTRKFLDELAATWEQLCEEIGKRASAKAKG